MNNRSSSFFEDWIDSVLESPYGNSRLPSNLFGFQEESKFKEQEQNILFEKQNILFEEPPFHPPPENFQNTIDVQASRRRDSDALKNFLPCVKRCLIELKGEQLSQIKDKEVEEFLKDVNKSNKKEFQFLFNN